MGSEWPAVPFIELCSHSAFGPRFSGEAYAVDGNVATLRTTDIRADGRIEYSTMPLAKLDLAKFRQHLLQSGDLVITRSGRVGTTAVFVEHRLPVLPGAFLICFRLRTDRADPKFYTYFFNSPEGQHLLSSVATGSAQQNLNITSVHRLRVPMPPLSVQKRISRILGVLDDKIEQNRRMSQTLEAMARALFKSWFVDFDPVRAKAEGCNPRLPEEVAELFPDSFCDSEFGEIPCGWRIAALGDIATSSRLAVKPTDIDPATPYIGLEHMPRKSIALAEWGRAESAESGKSEFHTGEILFGKLRPYFHKVGVAPTDGVCSTDIVVVVPKEELWFGVVLGHTSSDEFIEYTNASSAGTRMPRTSWTDMARFPLVVPPIALASAFTDQVRPAIDRIASSVHENRTLANVRDSLLPALVSGGSRLGS